MQHVFPIPLGDLPFLGYAGACRRQTGRDHPRFWMRPPRRHLSSFYAPARYFTQKASSGTALRTNCLPEARERKERTPKKERKKLKPRPPPRRKAGKQKNFSGTRKNRAPPENPILPGTWGMKRAQTWHHARARGARSAPRRHLAIFGGAKKHPFFRGSRRILETKQKWRPRSRPIHSAETEPEFPQWMRSCGGTPLQQQRIH